MSAVPGLGEPVAVVGGWDEPGVFWCTSMGDHLDPDTPLYTASQVAAAVQEAEERGEQRGREAERADVVAYVRDGRAVEASGRERSLNDWSGFGQVADAIARGEHRGTS